jgi:hypothetical protein
VFLYTITMTTINGISPKQTITSYKDSENCMIRKTIRNSWNNKYAVGVVNGHGRKIGPFKAVSNIGDFLNRQNYACGNMPNPTQANSVIWRSRIGSIIKNCDNTGVEASSSNNKFVPDSSEYIKYKKIAAINRNYNDTTNGGDDHNGSYDAMMRVRV